jgi:hypothetical protein
MTDSIPTAPPEKRPKETELGLQPTGHAVPTPVAVPQIPEQPLPIRHSGETTARVERPGSASTGSAVLPTGGPTANEPTVSPEVVPSKSGASAGEDEEAGVPTKLRSAAIVMSIAATILGGLWTLITLTIQTKKEFDDAATEREKLRLQTQIQTVATEQAKTQQLSLQLEFAKLSLQREQEARKAVEFEDKRQRQAEADRAKADEAGSRLRQQQEDQRLRDNQQAYARQDLERVDNAIAVLAGTNTAGQVPAAFIVLERYAANPAMRPTVLRALEVRAAMPVQSLADATAMVRLAETLMPESFDVLVGMRRRARESSRQFTRFAAFSDAVGALKDLRTDAVRVIEAASRSGDRASRDVYIGSLPAWSRWREHCSTPERRNAPSEDFYQWITQVRAGSQQNLGMCKAGDLRWVRNDVLKLIDQDQLALERELSYTKAPENENSLAANWLIGETYETLRRHANDLRNFPAGIPRDEQYRRLNVLVQAGVITSLER